MEILDEILMLSDYFDLLETLGECVIGGSTVDPEIAGGAGAGVDGKARILVIRMARHILPEILDIVCFVFE